MALHSMHSNGIIPNNRQLDMGTKLCRISVPHHKVQRCFGCRVSNCTTFFGHMLIINWWLCRYEFDFIRAALESLRNQYGSLYLRSSRTIFTNGDIDPKMYNGIIYTNDPESIALTILRKYRWLKGNGKNNSKNFHCLVVEHGRSSDIPSIQETDSAQLQEIKEEIIERIGNFSIPIWD